MTVLGGLRREARKKKVKKPAKKSILSRKEWRAPMGVKEICDGLDPMQLEGDLTAVVERIKDTRKRTGGRKKAKKKLKRCIGTVIRLKKGFW